MGAAIAVVTARGTADVPVSEIAEVADVSRRLVYQQYADRETLLLEAALDLARREVLPQIADSGAVASGRVRALAVARHMAEHRVFYRALLLSPCAYELSKALHSLFLPVNLAAVRERYGDGLDERAADDIARVLTGGWGSLLQDWLIEAPDPLDPQDYTDRVLRTAQVLLQLP
ncbi:TetR/AcrR family transcriptional regulator [Actinospica sp. MGRD01-02]|uniref:TetR/AcrR family transcriptional regulator n=1 Tax=Actinospica acidithermotolerans TaxID=2828514 RepID=A0A941IHT6_9ACTN|nr:TetR family transcriptional regulator [Actinospica acidithermotolerans]MBR7828870.1 TetR/AcrR family transcriptional regulator [Actinospica acidithermotolerans]